MKSKNVKVLMNTVKNYVKSNKSSICLGGGIGGALVSAFILGYKTPEFEKTIKEEKQSDGGLTVKKTAKAVAKCYAAPITGLAISGTSIGIGLKGIDNEKAGLVAVAKAAEESIKELSSKMDEELGEEKSSQIKKAVLKDRIARADARTEYTPCVDGEAWFFDTITGITFKSTPNDIYSAINDANEQMNQEGAISVGDLLYFYGIKTSERTYVGRTLGFILEKGLIRIHNFMDGDNGIIINGHCYIPIEYATPPECDYEHYRW